MNTMNTKTLLAVVVAAALAGCSAFGGKSTFGCPNTEQGAACLSARQIYSSTHVADRVSPTVNDDGKPIDKKVDQKSDAEGLTLVASNGLNSYRPPLPEVDTPLPIRTPAKVMRIRIFPWEDNSRDLNTGGYVYTEVEGRTWALGEEQVSRVQANVISPLQAPSRASSLGSTNTSPLQVPVAQSMSSTRQMSPLPAGQQAKPVQNAPSQQQPLPRLPPQRP